MVVTVEASDGKPDTAEPTADDDVTINVRVNVAPTAINLGGTAISTDEASPISTSAASLSLKRGGITAADAGTIGSFTLDVQDLNLNTDPFGTHDVKVDDDRFVLTRLMTGTDMSQWTLGVKAGAEFDFEDEDNPTGVITLKVTATDKGGKKVVGLHYRHAYRCRRRQRTGNDDRSAGTQFGCRQRRSHDRRHRRRRR